MADFVYADLSLSRHPKTGKAGSVRQKRMRTTDGEMVRVLALDANSKTFIEDLTTVFEKNVARARRENRRVLGSANGLRPKT